MAKRVQNQDEASSGRPRKKATTPRANNTSNLTTACEFCDQKFTTRGLKRHQNCCMSKKAADKKPRCYKFCILNETLFEIILSYLNNQALTKMQMITGDRYPNCEPQLASCCCKCEEDNPAIRDGLCRECDAKRPFYNSSVFKGKAKEKYCLREKHLDGLSASDRKWFPRYEQKELEMCAMELYGSKQAWLREIAHRKKLAAEKQQRKNYLESLAPGFAVYVKDIKWKRRGKTVLQQMSERFTDLKAALEQLGLSLETDSKACKKFITMGSENIEDVVERQFLFAQKSYWQQVYQRKAVARASQKSSICSSEIRLQMERDCEEAVKMELCVKFLQDNQGLTFPRKWESCRARLEEVKASGGDPFSMAAYIYAGIGIQSSAASAAQV